MHVKLRTIYASPTTTADAGTVIEVSEDEGAELVLRGFAAEVPRARVVSPETDGDEDREAPKAKGKKARK